MANKYWRGTSSVAFTTAGNWEDDDGVVASAVPTDGDSVFFDETPTNAPSGATWAIPNITFNRIVIGAAYKDSICDATNPFICGAKEVFVDKDNLNTEDMYLYSFASPNLTVRKDGTGDHSTIAAAITAASAGQVIFVYEDGWAATTYSESLTWSKELTIRAIGNVTINGGAGRAILTSGTVTTASILEGFTIKNTTIAGDGGGINIATGDGMTIRRCTISNCTITGANDGAGVYCDGTLVMEDCIVNGNTSAQNGGGIMLDVNASASCSIKRTKIYGNAAVDGGGLYSDAADGWTMENCLIYENTASDDGAGMFLVGALTASTIIENCTVTDNVATGDGGGVYCRGNCDCLFRNCIFWNDKDTTSNDNEIYLEDDTDDPGFVNCDIEGGTAGIELGAGAWTGTNTANINSDPKFTAAASDDYTIDDSSPCIDAGESTGAPAHDLAWKKRDNVTADIVDIGCYEWGDGSTAATQLPQGSYYHRFGTVSVTGTGQAYGTADGTLFIQAVMTNFYPQRGVMNVSKFSYVQTEMIVSSITNPFTDVTLTLAAETETAEGFYPPSEIEHLGGVVDCNTEINTLRTHEGQWTQGNGRNIGTVNGFGGKLIWESGDITTGNFYNGSLDVVSISTGEASIIPKTITTLHGRGNSVALNLNDKVGSVTVTNPMNVWGSGLRVPPGSKLVAA